MASGRRVLVASHDAPRCANVMARVHVGGMVTCLIADLASTDGAASLARAVATVMGDYACLRTVMLAASPGAVEYDPLLDIPCPSPVYTSWPTASCFGCWFSLLLPRPSTSTA